MRTICLYVFAVVFLVSSCGQHKNNPEQKPAENTDTVQGIEKLEFTDSLKLEANENMRFNKELFRVRAGNKICLILKNTSVKSGASMTHNVVVLKSGVDIADFADVAHKAKNEQYVPSSLYPLIIAHTKMVNAGQSDTVTFTIPQAGVHDFICSYPGHWGTMQGKIVAQ
ncbi:MAG TPA: plastocyanin/azurin family copper-binding protein [Puia sp.]|nr:plastocyanin/azurin family copper-binding protein [Puia sp.]